MQKCSHLNPSILFFYFFALAGEKFGLVPQGTWLIGTGLIMLGLNGVRYFNGIKMHGFTLVLGLLTLLAGLGDLFHLKLPLFAIFVIFIGVSIILKPLLAKSS
jgi:hypothetical protein